MHPDLQRLIALQRLDSAAHEAERRISEEPERLRAFDLRLDDARQHVEAARQRLGESQTLRRAIEKDVAVHQGRLSKYRDQIMSVKTNIEYQAMQKEIEFAQAEVKALEDRILERMIEADELTAEVKRAEAALAAEQKAVAADRQALAADVSAQRNALEQLRSERATLVAAMAPQILAIFDLVSRRRNGVAVAEARDGICTICHVRLRPQIFNSVRGNEEIIQCDSCQRVLFFVPPPTAAAGATAQPAP
jgi:uncharacterized protein